MIKITLDNPYVTDNYLIKETLDVFENDLRNYNRGNELILGAYTTSKGERITISPKNWGSMVYKEVQDE